MSYTSNGDQSFIISLPFPSSLPLWRGFGIKEYSWCGDGNLSVSSKALDFRLWSNQFSLDLFLFLALFLLFHLSFLSHNPLSPSFLKAREPCWEDEKLTKNSIMNGLKVPWAQYTLSLALHLFPMKVRGSEPAIFPTYIQLTMVNYENLKLTGVFRIAPYQNQPPP